jgi:hypothetical protein
VSIHPRTVEQDLRHFTDRGLLTDRDAAQMLEMFDDTFPFTEAMDWAESVHVHVTVDDVEAVPDQETLGGLAAEATGNEAERKFAFASGLHVVFAGLPTAQDELIPGAEVRPKPYVDHFGVDLREDSDITRSVFKRIPEAARRSLWRHVFQDGPIRCCHVEMGPKHWVYPPEGVAGGRRPIEFAFGELTASEEFLGCDYRPIDPAHPLAGQAAKTCGYTADAEAGTAVRPAKVHVFEECSCNTAPSRALLGVLQDRYGDDVDVRSFDLAQPGGLVPLPPELFRELQSGDFGALPALVVDGKVRTLGWLPDPTEAVRLIESPEAQAAPRRRPAADATTCCTDGSCC